MFYTTNEVPTGFFKQFLDSSVQKKIDGDSLNFHPMLPVKLYTGEISDVMVRYYKKSGQTGIEAAMQYFPCIVIQDYQPEVDKSQLFGKDWVEGFYDKVNSVRELITLPIPVTYRFQVSAITRKLKEAQGVSDWFFQNFDFQRHAALSFNEVDTEEGKVADLVPYWCTFGEVPRDDNRTEYAYDFTLKTYLHARAKNYTFVTNPDAPEGEKIPEGGNFKDAIEKIKFSLSIMDYASVRTQIMEQYWFAPSGAVVEDGSIVGYDNWSEVLW